MNSAIHVPLERWRPAPLRRAPRVPQRIVVFLDWRQTLVALACSALLLVASAACWVPVVLAIVHLCRRLHPH